ncbi:MAG: peptidoglycan DD-metalloendopeptidase family protein [Hyphomicrobiaceae bacterium]
MNGDTSAVDTRVAEAPLYDQQPDAAVTGPGAASRGYSAAPVSGVSRGSAPVTKYQPQSKPARFASNDPIVETPNAGSQAGSRSGYEPMTTGALPSSRNSITVEPGDTLYQLSRRHGVTVAALRQVNGLTSNTIKPGQRLALPESGQERYAAAPRANRQYRRAEPQRSRPMADPAGGTYVVRRGDSLYAIARQTGVSVARLKRLNGITNVRNIRPGVRLSLGGRAPATQVASRTNVTPRSQIRAKSITTMPIVRSKALPSGGAQQPRILNQRPDTPIATKPRQSVARTPTANTRQNFRWPARGRVIAAFNHSGQGTRNDGINIALPLGTDIGAAEGGVVAYAGSELKGYGNLVLVRHDNGWVSAYAHASEILVKRGDRIARGQVIAKAGRSGGVTQPQLHFELRKGAKSVDPMPHLASL